MLTYVVVLMNDIERTPGPTDVGIKEFSQVRGTIL